MTVNGALDGFVIVIVGDVVWCRPVIYCLAKLKAAGVMVGEGRP